MQRRKPLDSAEVVESANHQPRIRTQRQDDRALSVSLWTGALPCLNPLQSWGLQ